MLLFVLMTRKPLAAIIGKISIRPFLALPVARPVACCPLPVGRCRCHGQTGPRTPGAGLGTDLGLGPADKRGRRRICHLSLWHSWWMCLTCGSGRAPQSEASPSERLCTICCYSPPPFPIESPVILVLITLPHRMTLHTLRREHPVNNVRHSHWKYGLPMLDILTIFLANWAGQKYKPALWIPLD